MQDTTLNVFVEHFRSAFKQYDAAKEKFLELFATNPAYALEWQTGTMLLAQARYEIALEFEDVINNEDEAGFAEMLAEFEKRTLRRAGDLVRTESKSTSQMSNINEDAKAQAALEIIELIAYSKLA